MNDQAFATLLRQTAIITSRRASLLALSAAGLAGISDSSGAGAKKQNKKCKKDKRECRNDLADCRADAADCAAQVDQCTLSITAACAGEPNCLDSVPCCDILETCAFTEFFSCLLDTSSVSR